MFNKNLQIGINLIAPHMVTGVRRLYDQGLVNFCEIIVDNFIHIHPHQIKKAFLDIPVSLHLVASRFLEKSFVELKDLADYLRPWIKALEPIYVSDHLATFTQAGKRLPYTKELEYKQVFLHAKNRIEEWQNLLDSEIFFENYASLSHQGKHQVEFFKRIVDENKTNLLFDFSNAYISEFNHCGSVMSDWNDLIQDAQHFHVSGFRVEKDSQRAFDTHDRRIHAEVLKKMNTYFEQASMQNKTLVVEFNVDIDFDVWEEEIIKVKKAIAA